jgi:ABC-type sugar transport system permease subunit
MDTLTRWAYRVDAKRVRGIGWLRAAFYTVWIYSLVVVMLPVVVWQAFFHPEKFDDEKWD